MSEKFSIIKLNLDKLHEEIEFYIAKTNEQSPCILMNDETIDAIYGMTRFLLYKPMSQSDKGIIEFCGYKVFKDNTLKFGEVEIR